MAKKMEKELMKREHVDKRKKAYSVLLALPPIISTTMIFIILFTNKAPVIVPQGVMLSPVRDATPLILSLTLFTVLYLLFIGLIFRENVKKIFYRKNG